MSPDPDEPDVWTYVPRPLLDRTPDGAPAIGLIEAGTTGFLQVTARLGLPDERVDALLTGVRAVHPEATAVRGAPIDVHAVVVEIRSDHGSRWAELASSTSSGLPPWIAAMSAVLTADQTPAVKAALSGTHGRVRLRAAFAPGRNPTGPRTPESPASGCLVERTADIADLLEHP
ncbi:hypothetical protein [Cryptosporangium sp. NPDC051539]|uniref:hypothetical protein n=1 Tax=Cryptosporangium sp. NPDC051539 TaxID=3363962 RepID=UPI0037892E13